MVKYRFSISRSRKLPVEIWIHDGFSEKGCGMLAIQMQIADKGLKDADA
jgi:hypothetical protein